MKVTTLPFNLVFKVTSTSPSLVPLWTGAIPQRTLTLMQVDSCCAVILSSLVFLLGVRWFWWHQKRRETLKSSTLANAALAVFITGCDTGIGFETALLLDRLGFTVFAGCLLPDGEGAKLLRQKASPKLTVINIDVTDQLKVDFALKFIEKKIEALHLTGLWSLINNAGIYIVGHLDWLTWEQCQRQIEVNLLGVIRVTKACLPLLKKTKGRIINISSFCGQIAMPYRSVYSATKFGLEGFSDSLRIELINSGVHVALIRMSNHSRLTNICKRQNHEAIKMWLGMNATSQKEYKMVFWKMQRNVGFVPPYAPYSFEDTTVLQDIFHALTSSHPRAFYNSGTCWDVAIFHAFSRLPTCIRDRIISQVL